MSTLGDFYATELLEAHWGWRRGDGSDDTVRVGYPRWSSMFLWDFMTDTRMYGIYIYIWLVVWNIFYFPIQLGISSSQLTNSYFSEGFKPTRYINWCQHDWGFCWWVGSHVINHLQKWHETTDFVMGWSPRFFNRLGRAMEGPWLPSASLGFPWDLEFLMLPSELIRSNSSCFWNLLMSSSESRGHPQSPEVMLMKPSKGYI